mmetsp:Transcript_96482/g.241989  ORF Transcript_96482/g.241989 Transcript_96482/m.241989 type:complete len:210 (+) Transcript_96482:253-882(+)
MLSAIHCILAKWLSGTSSSAKSVTSAWIPTRNHKSSPVFGCLATVRPRRSSKFKKSSPVFLRFGRTAVKGAPVSAERRKFTRSSGSTSQPLLRKRQFTPSASVRVKPVMVSKASDTAIRGQSFARGSAMVTQKSQLAARSFMPFLTRTSLTSWSISVTLRRKTRCRPCDPADMLRPSKDTARAKSSSSVPVPEGSRVKLQADRQTSATA